MAKKEIKPYIDNKTAIINGITIAAAVILGMTITSTFQPKTTNNNQSTISTESTYQKLDKNKLNSKTTTVEDRKIYYQKNVDTILKNMTAKEKNAFYVKLNLKYQNNKSNSTDNLTFLRNDNQYQKDISIKTKTVSIPPGIYKLLSDNVDLGEIELLTPGTNLNISIDYTTKTITIETTDPKTK